MSKIKCIPPFGLRMPADLKEWVVKTAKNDRRSMNNFLITIIEKAKAESEKEQAA